MTSNLPQDPDQEQADSVEYNHSLLCMLTLPRSRQMSREYIREYQGWSLKLEAGDLYDGNKWVPQPLPYGPKARLAFMHICSEAVKVQSRFIEAERSPRAFMDRIGIGNDGRNYRLFRQQINALGACSFLLGGREKSGEIVTRHRKPIEDFKAWATKDDENQPALWASCLQLSESFYQDLIEHAVPLSANALRGLSNSALALDYYCFFAYRLHALERPVVVSWQQLHAQFGQDYADAKDFRKRSIPMIQAALAVYPSAKVDIVHGGLRLHPSFPPIARQSVGVSQGLADRVQASLPPAPQEPPRLIQTRRLHYKTIERFKKHYPRLDVYACESDFNYWLETSNNAEPPRSYDAAFWGFAKKWVQQNG